MNDIVFNKLLLQAEEAKDQGMVKLASGILSAFDMLPEKEASNEYSYEELNSDIYNGLWKLATNVIKYHDVNSADIEKINYIIESLASKFVENIETSIKIESGSLGPFEPKIIGEK